MSTKTENNPWSQFDDKVSADKYFKFVKVGDTLTGVIAEIGVRTFDEGTDKEQHVPEITLTDGRVCTFGQRKAMQHLLEAQPLVGEEFAAKFTGTQKAGAGQMKLFRITVVRDGEAIEFGDGS